MFFNCCYFKKKEKEKIKVSCSYCNSNPYAKSKYEDYYDDDLTIKELKKIILDKINNDHSSLIKYNKIHFINKKINNDHTLGAIIKYKEINIIYDLE